MSKSVSVIITDDLDGSENAKTVSFGFDGVTYENDLGKKNRARLEKALAPSSRLAGERRAAAAAVAPAPGWLTGCLSPRATAGTSGSCRCRVFANLAAYFEQERPQAATDRLFAVLRGPPTAGR